jgi:hypothetical protein
VVALEENLAATADAHELMAEFVEASGGISSADEGEDREKEKSTVGRSAKLS